MRGWDVKSDALFSYVSCEARVPKDHPLRPIRQIVDKALAALSPEFEKLYAQLGRPSIPPERLLRALLLQAFYSVRSELQLIFPWHRRTDAQVPYKSPNESHASYTPGTAWPVGRFPPRSSGAVVQLQF